MSDRHGRHILVLLGQWVGQHATSGRQHPGHKNHTSWHHGSCFWTQKNSYPQCDNILSKLFKYNVTLSKGQPTAHQAHHAHQNRRDKGLLDLCYSYVQ